MISRQVARVVGALLGFVGAARADNSGPSVWYRSSEGCPDGAAFLARLGPTAEGALLASAGDRVDFVVTLGAAKGRASGALERQTASGTVAIRKVESQRCEDVADALALTLTLALDPARSGAGTAGDVSKPEPAGSAIGAPLPAPAAPVAPVTAAAPVTAVARPPSAAPRPAETTETHDRGASAGAPPARAPERSSSWWLGAELGLRDIVTSGSMPNIGVFARYERDAGPLPGASVRLGIEAGKLFGAAEDIDLWLLTTKVEACPLQLSAGFVDAAPCVGGEVGALGASSAGPAGRSDSGLWAALDAAARVCVRVGPRFFAGAAFGVSVPLSRYELVAESSGEQTETIGLFGAAQASYRLP